MATTAQIASIQQLYVAYFNRPADAAGLDFWAKQVANGATLDTISATFAATPEYKALFAGMSNDQVVNQIYQNLFNRAPDASGLKFWSDKLTDGALTVDNVVAAVAASAQQDPAAGPDTIAIQSKVAAAVAFTDYLNTDVDARIAYSSGAVNSVGVNYIHSVTNAATLAAAQTSLPTTIDDALENGGGVPGSTFALTLGNDTIVGTAGNDTITANNDTASGASTVTGLDNINGGAGNDTLNITDASIADTIDLSVATVANVETLNVTSLRGVAGNAADVSGFTGLTQANFSTKAVAATTYTGATTTAATIGNTTAQGVTVVGFGGNVSVTNGAGAVVIGDASAPAASDANAIVSATVKGGTTVAVTDNSGAAGVVGATLTTVSLNGNTGAATLTGNAITNVTVTKAVAASDVTIANTKAHALTLTLNESTGLDVTDAEATSVILGATGKASDLNLVAAKATSLSVNGDKDITLSGSTLSKLTTVTVAGAGVFKADLSGVTTLDTVNASAATGGIDVTIVGTNTVGTGEAQSVTGGAGNDKVTITGTLSKGSVLDLGAGTDTVAVSGAGLILGDAVVDAGAGNDTLSLSVVDATNVGAFKNFELFDVANVTGTFDQAILDTKNDVTGFVGTAALGGATELTNIGAGVGFTVLGTMGVANALTLTQATAGALTITSNVDQTEAAAAVQNTDAHIVASNATSLRLVFDNNNIDKLADYANTATLKVDGGTAGAGAATSIAIVSGGSEVKNIADINGFKSGATNDALTSITVTGDQALTINYTKEGVLKLASVDASGQTAGGLTFDLANLTTTGTIKLGAGDDVLAAVTADSTLANSIQTINGMEKAAAEGQTSTAGFDVLTVASAVQAADHASGGAGQYVIKDGVYTLASGVTTLAGAVAQIAANLTANEVVTFNYVGSTYVYATGATAGAGANQADDVLVKITGTTGVTGLDVDTGNIYLIG